MRWFKDPLILFFIGGAGLFAMAEFVDSEEISYQIDIREADLSRLNDQWAMQMRRPATEKELENLTEQLIKEEIYYREAKRLGLDQNDTIVRRRMVQKLTFLTEDIATTDMPDEETLKDHYDQNIEKYRQPKRYSFQHRYFSSDRRKDAKQDAEISLLNTKDLGDPFMLQKTYNKRSEREIADLFGREFSESIANLEPSKQWQGPVKSAYGFHTLLLESIQESYLKGYETVKERVLIDFQQETRRTANEQYLLDLRNKYSVNLHN